MAKFVYFAQIVGFYYIFRARKNILASTFQHVSLYAMHIFMHLCRFMQCIFIHFMHIDFEKNLWYNNNKLLKSENAKHKKEKNK